MNYEKAVEDYAKIAVISKYDPLARNTWMEPLADYMS